MRMSWCSRVGRNDLGPSHGNHIQRPQVRQTRLCVRIITSKQQHFLRIRQNRTMVLTRLRVLAQRQLNPVCRGGRVGDIDVGQGLEGLVPALTDCRGEASKDKDLGVVEDGGAGAELAQGCGAGGGGEGEGGCPLAVLVGVDFVGATAVC